MAAREAMLSRIPRLSEKEVGLRQGRGAKIEERHERRRQHKGQIIYTFPSMPHIEPWLEVPSLEYLSRLARRETILDGRAKEGQASVAKGQEHERPAIIANKAFRIETDYGVGWIPYESNHHLLKKKDEAKLEKLKKIKKIFIIQHGVLRNAGDYYNDFIKALRERDDYDPETTWVIAPQFLSRVDVKPQKSKPESAIEIINRQAKFKFQQQGEEFLYWRYNDWRGCEPAMNPEVPIDSFTAMDQLVASAVELAPNAEVLEFRGNSEGAQFLDRYLAYSKILKRFDVHKDIQINGVISNAGTQHYFDSFRPVFDSHGNIIEWKDYGFESDENLWPLGLYDPPPYILESLDEEKGLHPFDPLVLAISRYLDRTTLGIGTADSLKRASHLPTGKGYRSQGITRVMRFTGKDQSLERIKAKYEEKGILLPMIKILRAVDFDHAAGRMFIAAEMARVAQRKFAEKEKE